MYLNHFDLKKEPFGSAEVGQDSFLTEIQKESLDRMVYAANNRRFVMLFGEPGTGKSTILRCLKEKLKDSNHLFLYLIDSRMTPSGLYNGLLESMGLGRKFYRADSMRMLHQELDSRRAIDRMEVVIAIDEAHLLEKDTIEEIRFLLNSDMDSKNPICLILSGQLELWERLEMRSSVAIKQRVDIMCRLAPFSRDETSDYIQYRLRRAGVERTVFTDEAVDQIYGQTSGIARKIDKLCDRCLLRGYIDNSKLINDHTVKIIAQTEMM